MLVQTFVSLAAQSTDRSWSDVHMQKLPRHYDVQPKCLRMLKWDVWLRPWLLWLQTHFHCLFTSMSHFACMSHPEQEISKMASKWFTLTRRLKIIWKSVLGPVLSPSGLLRLVVAATGVPLFAANLEHPVRLECEIQTQNVTNNISNANCTN